LAAETLNTRYEILETAPDADTLPFTISRAQDVMEERIVSLVTLPGRRIAVPAKKPAFIAAVQQAGSLDHPCVTRIYDQGDTSDGGFYLSTEYLRGMTLKERIRRIAPFTLAVAADIAVAVAEALEYAHAQGVVHGDLRPHHVLLSPEGQIKVSGFAYAHAATSLTASGRDPLYAAYASPEQKGDLRPTASADIYALGVTLFEMLTGSLPTADEVAAPSPRAFNPGIPPALEGIVQKSLNPDPSLRYRNAASLLADLRAVREALRAGRSLAWSPVTERRVPRPSRKESEEAATVTAIPSRAEDQDEEADNPVRAVSRALSITVAILSFIAVLIIVGLSWYLSRFLAIPNDVNVPNLIGRTMDQATQIAAQDHFVVIQQNPNTPQYSAIWPQNQIFQQTPSAGHTVKAGQDVMVVVSAGPPLLQVPDLSGMTQSRATQALQDANLPLGNVTEDYSSVIPAGNVISQAPGKLAMVPRGTEVNFVVSRGIQPPEVPQNVTAQTTDSSTVVLNWNQAARATSYTVDRVENGISTTIATGLPADQTQDTDTDLTPETSYTYTVTAVNSGGSSVPSAPVTVETPANVPVPPVLPPAAAPDNSGTGPADNGDGTGGANGDNSGTGSAGAGSASAPPSLPSSPASETAGPRLRQFTISFRVPFHPDRQRHVQFEIQDALGLSWPFDEWRAPGTEIDSPVQAFGNRITFRIFLDGKLVKQETL
jgi:beta-lactam-binding protein with PASTA domain